MSPGSSATNSRAQGKLTLDAASFEKLLMAAYVLQCERDRLSADHDRSDVYCLEVSANRACESSRQTQAREPASSLEPAMHKPIPDQIGAPVVTPPKVPPVRVDRVCSAETSGALALAPSRSSSVDRPHALQKVVSKDAARVASRPKPLLILIPSPARERSSNRGAMQFLRSLPAIAYAGGALLLVALLVLITFALEGHHQSLSTASGEASQLAKGSGVASSQIPNLSVLESTHLHITDASVSSQLDELSRFEFRMIRRQAEFGDDNAALVLGMAYEIGQGVPQNCAQAAHWVEVAAQDGDPAAEYNLGLRYMFGDGVSLNYDQGRRWLQSAAGQGYEMAQVSLRQMQF